jgi:hypothetical protein
MRFVILILSVLGVVYGALLVAKPHMAVQRSQVATPTKLLTARIKGVLALTMGAFMLWRTLV